MKPRPPVDLTEWEPGFPDPERRAALDEAREHLRCAAELWTRSGRLWPETKPFPEGRTQAITLFGLTAEQALYDAMNAAVEL